MNDQSEYANWREVVHGHPSVQTARQAYEDAPTARSWDEYVRAVEAARRHLSRRQQGTARGGHRAGARPG